MRLNNKVSLVTGAGSGIGQGIAIMFAKEGSKVLVCDIDHAAAKKTVEEIKAQGNHGVAFEIDVSQSRQVKSVFAFVSDHYGRLDILCNNAGIFGVEKYFLVTDLPEEVWNEVISVNLTGTYLCCKYLVPLMLAHGGGSIINIASMAGLIASERAAYSASKGGLIALTRTLAKQFARQHIRVNAICPGPVDTPGVKDANSVLGQMQFPIKVPLLDRIGKPDDIANVATYLASDESSWVTGAIFCIDGGVTAY
jgi:NAD(P)-dependent dehydrogenase (short-subunit alcohol dehydrogenase family)